MKRFTAVFLVLLVFVAGCAVPFRQGKLPAERVRQQVEIKAVRQGEAQLRPGLVVEISVIVSGKKEIDERAKRVSERNTLMLPLLDTISVEGLTLEKLCERLTREYQEYFIDPQVVVEFVRDDSGEALSPWGFVTVLGRVKKPGRVSLPATRDMTVSGAIQQAGGFDTSAKDTAIRITRRTDGGRSVVLEVDLRAVGARGRVEQDVGVQSDDVIFVPELVF